MMGALAATLVVFFLVAKVSARLSARKTFDIGGNFDHFYSRILPAAHSGAVYLIFAGYVALWLLTWPREAAQRLGMHSDNLSGRAKQARRRAKTLAVLILRDGTLRLLHDAPRYIHALAGRPELQ